ncbi:MAG: FAD-dependent oxidoreductase, partial [Lentisphaeria bacterium]|nr:FAD-dependent oxidoreductase [Lentisphaeria bacterium]
APGNAAEIEARRLAVELTRHLTRDAPDFSEATVSEVALETAYARQRDWAGELIPQGLTRAPCDLPLEACCNDVATLYRTCMEHGATCTEETPRTLDAEEDFVVQSGEAEIPGAAFSLRPFHDPKLALTLTAMDLVTPDFLPLREQCDVLVAGGGTAGANTALAALSKDAKTVLMEANADLGGTQTLGMVASYFHGYKGGWTERQEQQLATFNDNLHNGRKGARWATKLLFYDRSADEAGATCLFHCTVCGALVENGQVSGLIGADASGLFRVLAKVTVDATGDGDAAVFCGAQATFGCPRTGNVQDYSQWSKGKGGTWGTTSKNLDLDVIDQRFLSENLRGVRIAHSKGFDYDFVPMLTVREGRHIVGEYTLDMVDILEGRIFADGIAEAQTTWDPHGISSSWLGRLGFLPVHCDLFYVQIPYRACVPKGLSGLLVTAKAISATVDAACFCRMAADVQNLGWATGLAAAEAAARHGGDVRAIDIEALHCHLAEMGIVRSDDPPRAKVVGTPAERVKRLAGGDETALLDVAVLPSGQALPQLRIAFDDPNSDRANVARALAWFGDASGATILRETLADLAFHESALYDDTHPHKEGNPRAGIVDEADDYWRVNQLLTLLGRLGDQAAAPQVASIIERTSAGGKPLRELNKYIAGRIDMQRVPHFDRLLCIAFCVERLGTTGLAAPMEWLLDREWIGGQSTRGDEDAAGPLYHSALAEVKLAAAAARCGSRKGLERLVQYLDDLHEILSAFAHQELAAVTDVDFGRDADAWTEWLATQITLPCAPLKGEQPVF